MKKESDVRTYERKVLSFARSVLYSERRLSFSKGESMEYFSLWFGMLNERREIF